MPTSRTGRSGGVAKLMRKSRSNSDLQKKLTNLEITPPEEKNSPETPNPKKPPKFSWVIDGLLAGHGRPSCPGHVEYLSVSGVHYLVTLTINKPKALHEYTKHGMTWVHIPIQDETPPSTEQITKFVEVVDRAKEESKAVSVHCAWGRGRTGTMLAAYLAKVYNLLAEDAIQKIRQMRPGSIDTKAQADAVRMFLAQKQ